MQNGSPIPKAAAQIMQNALANGKGEMPIACERCRRRKQKCDRRLPSCSNCLKSGHECNVPDVTDRRRAVGSQSARLPKGYIEQLEAQVRYLESSIQEKITSMRASGQTAAIAPPEPTIFNKPDGYDNGHSVSWANQGTTTSPMDLDGEDNLHLLSATASLTHTNALSTPNGMPQPATDMGALPTMSILSLSNIGDSTESGPFTFSKVLSTIIRSDGRNPGCSSRLNPYFADLADAIPHALPDMAGQLSGTTGKMHMDKYFRVVQFRYPCLDQKEVEEYYQYWVKKQSKEESKVVAVGDEEWVEEIITESAVKNFIIYMVLAIGITLDEESASHSSFFSNHFLFSAIRHFEAVLEGNSNSNTTSPDDPIDTIRALLLLAIYSLYSPSAGPTWHFIGLAIRKAICLGYHMEIPPTEGDETESVREKRRWVFWSAYVLDRCVCQALGRPLSIQDSDVTSNLPTPSPKNPAEVFAVHFMKYNLIRTDFMKNPDKDFTYHFTNLVHWRSTTPRFPADFDPALRITINDYFDGVYYGALLLLAKPSPKPALTFPDLISSPAAHRKLSHIAFASIYVLRSAAKRVENSSFVSWLVGFRVFKAGLVFLRSVLLLSSFRRRYCTVEQVSSDMGSVMDVLTAVGAKFDDLKKYRGVFRVLKRGFEKFLEAEKMGLRPPAFRASEVDFTVVTLTGLKLLLEEVCEILEGMSSPASNGHGNGMSLDLSNGLGNGMGTPLSSATPNLLTPLGFSIASSPGNNVNTNYQSLNHYNYNILNGNGNGNSNGHEKADVDAFGDLSAMGYGGYGGFGGDMGWSAFAGATAPGLDAGLQDRELYEILFGTAV